MLSSDLLQRLRTRENEQRRQQQRSRGNRDGRKSLSYDAAPFNIQVGASSSQQQDQPTSSASTIPSEIPLQSSSSAVSNSVSGTDLSVQRRQLGERLYPKVQIIQPVCFLLSHFT